MERIVPVGPSQIGRGERMRTKRIGKADAVVLCVVFSLWLVVVLCRKK